MTNFVPIFPLELVVFPGETLRLHIFEPRYRQLIGECIGERRPFGIPTVLSGRIQERGTLALVKELAHTHSDGSMDIVVEGEKVFRILEIVQEVPDKLYAGAIVNYPANSREDGEERLMQSVLNALKDLHRLLRIRKDIFRPGKEPDSYAIAHHAGLSLDQEYEFHGLLTELHRQEYLKRHLLRVVPLMREMEQLKTKIRLNGHFRNIQPPDLNFR